MTLSNAYQQLRFQLLDLYGDSEATSIASMMVEHITGFDRLTRIDQPEFTLNEAQLSLYQTSTDRLLRHEPVQYVIGEAWFYRYPFLVNANVLIPRPETEELVLQCLRLLRTKPNPKVLDIGTGSGCIAISLKKDCPAATVQAIDVSAAALSLARQNATRLAADIDFSQINFLDQASTAHLGIFDLVVSNPPYIAETEKNSMEPHVVAHEPGIALFVPDDDPLIFYRRIIAFAAQHLAIDGAIAVEISEYQASATLDLFKAQFADAQLHRDLQGKPRMITAYKK
jgi:release factor glutamine methyltransferase